MSVPVLTLQRLQQRAVHADQVIAQLRAQLDILKKNAAVGLCRAEEAKLESENASLKQEIIILKDKLVGAEVRNGLKQVSLPAKSTPTQSLLTSPVVQAATVKSETASGNQLPKQEASQKPQQQQQKKKDKKEKKEPKEQKPPVEAAPIDVSRLDMRIGHIVTVKKHPDADGLYVEEVNLGEGRNRTIVSGLVKHVLLDQMQDRHAIFLINLKPAKMRGIMSEGMIMCASTPEKVEIINPPAGVEIGESVTVDGYSGAPDQLLNPKKKVWEQIQPELHINADGAATYKGALWGVSGKGACTVPTMRGTGIK